MGHTTPIILYNLSQIDKALEGFPALVRSEPAATRRPRLYHSLKANAFPPLLEYFAERGMGASVSNQPEYALAREIGFHHICATAPSLDDDSIDEMIADGCDVFLSTARQVAKRRDGSRIALRLRAPRDASARTSRFGFDLEDLQLHELIRDKGLTVNALLLHHRNIDTAEVLTGHVGLALRAHRLFPSADWVNLGGGMTALAGDALGWRRAWDQLLCDPRIDSFLQSVSFEPGAQHLSAAGYLMSSVIDSATDPAGHQNVVLDASHWCLNGWSQIQPIVGSGQIPTDLYGATCYEDDVWCRDLAMPALGIGDLIGFGNMGSYITSMARNFCKIPMPQEALFRSELPPTLKLLADWVNNGRSYNLE
jgi:diaminopimelate decarboxylase